MRTASYMIEQYTAMKSTMPNSSMLREVSFQYQEMAAGGDGGTMGYTPKGFNHEPTCREYNYPGYPDTFFQEVCEGMGW